MKSILILLTLVTFSQNVLERNFQNNIFNKKYFGIPEKVFFLSPTHILMADANSYSLLNTSKNELEYIRSETMDSFEINSLNQLILYNQKKASIYTIDPFTDTLIKSTSISHINLKDVIITKTGVYFVKENQIIFQKENQIEEIEKTLENKIIIKLKLDSSNANQFHLFTFSKDSSEICLHSIDLNLQSINQLNCFPKNLFDSQQNDVLDIYINEKNELVQIYPNFYQVNEFKTIVNEDLSLKSSMEKLQIVQNLQDVPSCYNSKSGSIEITCQQNKPIIKTTLSSQPDTVHIIEIDSHDWVTNAFISPDNQYVLLSTRFATLILFNVNQHKTIMNRDESLNNINEVIFLQKSRNLEDQQFLHTYETYLNNKNIIAAWALRLKHSIRFFIDTLIGFQTNLGKFLTGLINGNIQSAFGTIFDFNNQDPLLKTLHTSKVAIIFTKSGKIWTYDMETSNLSNSISLIASYKPVHEGTINFAEINSKSACFVSKLNKYQILLNCKNNQNLKSTKILSNTLELIDYSESVIEETPQYLFDINPVTNALTGSLGETQIWSIQIPSSQKLIKLDRIQDFKIPNSSFQIENANVLYKLVDPNNALLITQNGQNVFIYVINLKIGKVLSSFTSTKISDISQLRTLVDDNSFFVSYFNPETLTPELFVIEIFRKRIEHDFFKIIKAEFSSKEKFLPQINYSNVEPEFVVLHKKYGLPVHVKRMKAFDSNVDLTSKNLLLITPNEQIYSLPRTSVSTRKSALSERQKIEEQLARPNKAKVDASYFFKSLTLEPYEYQLPLNPKFFLTKNLRIPKLENVWLEPTAFESTAFLIATGKHLFVTTHSPNGQFDQLPEDFNKPMLWVMFVGFVVAIFISNRFAAKKKPVQKFLSYVN